jgi:predicted helicase
VNPGKSLEQLVEVIEKAIAANQPLTIESPCRMRDKVTGRLREHDVVLHAKQGHHIIHVAIECRDRSRMVTVGQVEAFHQKCLHTGIDKGVIVSSKGFCATAVKKAEHLGIRCLTLAAAQNLTWLATDYVA